VSYSQVLYIEGCDDVNWGEKVSNFVEEPDATIFMEVAPIVTWRQHFPLKSKKVCDRMQGAKLHKTVILIFTVTKMSVLTNTHMTELAMCGSL
jgi:hypothetical protein